ncbi:hypothetical protein [Singulisphaera acidiphila]|uniref:Uncharacterized protein n=1 Tax=Singulisphaera acidiphila (strain ATCC BAA-1392 / DSM 18658 / VKM B-2454 / MOB10) TaxID=886293 RepID=L0DIR2_SINAD|nr:hypothetical protein [Singulisphaera acidiphila]AGA28541.1 hypothetical protein Sinac_4344 [Singulisphaera acidiphila DSM 18658]
MVETGPVPVIRRFNLGDLMILTIAVAVSLAPAVKVVSSIAESFAKLPPSGRSLWYYDDFVWWWAGVVSRVGPRSWVISGVVQLLLCLFTPLAPALVVARLRRPRPPLRLIACQPGFVACALICLALLVGMELTILRIGLVPPPVLMVIPGALVITAWSILAARRQWRRERSWVDRAGRIVGMAWIALLPWMIWSAF